MHSLAKRYVASRRAHGILWELIDLVAGTAMVFLVWHLMGRAVGLAFAILFGVLTLLGLVVLIARTAHARRAK